MRGAQEIYELYRARKERLDPLHKAALEVRAAYNGEITLPMPELDRNEKALVPNLVFSAGEQQAMRVASTMPNVYFPSTRPGINVRDNQARDRRLVTMAWWDRERMKLKMRKRARHLLYYASTPVMVFPHFKEHRPAWKVVNPLGMLPPEMEAGEVVPEDIIFTYPKSYAWLVRKYPMEMARFGSPRDIGDATFTLLQYQDDDENVLCVVGEKVIPQQSGMWIESVPSRVESIEELERTPNLLGRCSVVIAGAIGLEYGRGRFDGTIGLWQTMAKMMALETIGTQRTIWPEQWIVDDPTGDGAQILTPADPLRGIVGHIAGGKLETVVPQINQNGMQIIDRLERGMRLDAGIPAELGGESTSNIRTGRRGDQILSSVLDFPLQEAQEILAVSLQEENKIAIAIDKTYFPTRKSIYISATAGEIEYQANELFETDTHYVAYSHAGVDAQGIVVELGQMVGTGMMSKRSAMETHPLIEDPQGEFDRITQEHVRDGLLEGLTQMAQDPNMAPVIAQVMVKLRESETEVEDAVLAVHEAMQEMQAQQQAQQQAQGPPGMPGAPPSPDAQPGMADPNAGIQAPPQGLSNLTALLTQLHRGASVGPVPNQLGVAS